MASTKERRAAASATQPATGRASAPGWRSPSFYSDSFTRRPGILLDGRRRLADDIGADRAMG